MIRRNDGPWWPMVYVEDSEQPELGTWYVEVVLGPVMVLGYCGKKLRPKGSPADL